MAPKLTIAGLGFAVVAAALIGFVFSVPAGAQAPAGVTRTVFASVMEKNGTPISGLAAPDFEVREDGKLQSIASVKPAAMPLRVHIIVSDGGSGAFQLGVLRLMQALAGRTEFALTSVLVQPARILNFTDNVQSIGDAIQKLGQRGTGKGGNQLMEAIRLAIEDIASPGKHGVLIVLRIGNEEASTITAVSVREALRKSGATMYVVSRTGASKAPPTFAGVNSMTAEAAQRQMDDTELRDTALQLNLVLGDGSRDSGGYQVETALTSAVPTLQQLASEIKNQYEITYSLVENAKPSDKLQLTTRLKNVTLRAPSRIPN
ncbi:MAG TPA: hypothetical protein VL243_02255 [Vicinamibacterales bacterium]|nr:hypothetical protein [Vicinamibacterales bacterium]